MWVQAVWYNVFCAPVFLPYFSMVTLSLPLLMLGSKSTCLSPVFCARIPRQGDMNCWEFNIISGFFCFFVFGQMESVMRLVSCRSHGLLTQVPAPNLKCQCDIWSFLMLPNLLDCLICTRSSVSIVLLLWMIGGMG